MPPKYNRSPSALKAYEAPASYDNESIYVTYEFQAGRDLVKPGARVKFKNDRGEFKFRCLVTNTALNVTWIDCINVMTGEWRSFYVERFKCLVKPKKSRRKKPIT